MERYEQKQNYDNDPYFYNFVTALRHTWSKGKLSIEQVRAIGEFAAHVCEEDMKMGIRPEDDFDLKRKELEWWTRGELHEP